MLDLILAINQQVNAEIRYVDDQVQYGKREVWIAEPPSKMGDCEDYALTKMSRLRPRIDLDMKVVYVELPQPSGKVRLKSQPVHAVLVVDDKWVLDNRTNRVMTTRKLREAGWRFLPYDTRVRTEQALSGTPFIQP